MLGNQSQLRNINSSSITAKGCWVNTRSIIDVNTRIRGHIIAGTCIQASVEPGSVRGTATAMIEPLPRMLSLFAALLLLGSSGAVQLFVVVSAPRSGTEWLRLMLAGHPRVCCDGEVLLRLGRRAQRPGGLDIRRALDAFARGAAPEYDDVLRCVEIKFTARSS